MQIPGIKRNWIGERFRSLIGPKLKLLVIELGEVSGHFRKSVNSSSELAFSVYPEVFVRSCARCPGASIFAGTLMVY
jgi:hypothetical protein